MLYDKTTIITLLTDEQCTSPIPICLTACVIPTRLINWLTDQGKSIKGCGKMRESAKEKISNERWVMSIGRGYIITQAPTAVAQSHNLSKYHTLSKLIMYPMYQYVYHNTKVNIMYQINQHVLFYSMPSHTLWRHCPRDKMLKYQRHEC